MRVTVSPDRHPSWGFTLSDATHLNQWVRAGVAWVLAAKNGLEGWFESAESRVDPMPDVPGVDGAYWPEEILLSSRTLAIRGHVLAVDERASSVGVASARDRIAALVGEPVSVTVEDAAGSREVRGYVEGRSEPEHRNETSFSFMLVVTCPDPLKYGSPVSVPAAGETVYNNTGTGDIRPRFTTLERITRLHIEQPHTGKVVEWAGDTVGLTLDLADGTPLDADGYEVGTLVWADAVSLPHGQSSLNVTVEPAGTQVMTTYRPGWR